MSMIIVLYLIKYKNLTKNISSHATMMLKSKYNLETHKGICKHAKIKRTQEECDSIIEYTDRYKV